MRRWPRLILIALIVLILFIPSFVKFYTDWLWFASVGYKVIFLKIIYTKLLLGLVFGAAFFVFLYANILIARALAPKYMVVDENEVGGRLRYQFQVAAQRYRISIDRYFNIFLFFVAVFLSLGAAASAVPFWDMVLRYLNQVSFGQNDPLFNRDLGYYVFNLPFLKYLRSLMYSTVILTVIVSSFVHFFDGAIRVRSGVQRFAAHVKAHLSVLIGILFGIIAFDYWLRRAELLQSPRGVVFGASYTDVHALLPALNLLSLIAIICAILLIVNIWFRGWLLPVVGISVLAAASLIIGTIYPALVQQYRVSPNEIVKETPYINLNIKYTREAYNLNQIAEKQFPSENTLTAQSLDDNEDTISNIRLWDWRPLQKTYEQIQGIRPYYVFSDVDVDRYKLDGKYTQVLLSPRELSPEQLPSTAQTWLNKYLVFTHGYGLVMSEVSKVTGDGLPELLIKDVPPTAAPGVKITRPELYFSEIGSEYVFAGTKTKEFDYPEGDANKYSSYRGDGGITINGIWDKVVFAIRFKTLKVLLSDSIDRGSKVLIYRHVSERVNKIAPFLAFDRDPYLVIREDGRLFWLLDGYTMTNMYPYSQPFDQSHNYIRNSVKVSVDAYNGDVIFYVADAKDPLITAYAKIFPGVFEPFNKMPADLKEHIRYPVDYFDIQTHMYSTYHMQDAQVFYNKEDQWNIPNELVDQQEQKMDPYYIIMTLPEETRSEMLLMTPYTPKNKNNMIAWIAARNDMPDYGKLLVYKFPKQKLIYGSMQIEARISQDPEISSQLTLWNQQGSSVIRGNLLVIPIEKSLIYVEPLYLQAEQTQLPELKRVIVSYGSSVVMEPSLGEALSRIFGGETTREPEDKGKPAPAQGLQEMIKAANDAYQAAIEAQRSGNWAEYGQMLKKLEAALSDLSKQSR